MKPLLPLSIGHRLLLSTCRSALPHSSAELSIPEQHELDEREYRRFVLDNDLKVLLVHDPRDEPIRRVPWTSASAPLGPQERPRLGPLFGAHVCGAPRKYPEEGEFGRYLRSLAEDTSTPSPPATTRNFALSDPPRRHGRRPGSLLPVFHPARSSAPSSPSEPNRLVRNCNEQQEEPSLDDCWRRHHLMNNFYDPEHPARHFSTGNEETLKDVDQGTAEVLLRKTLQRQPHGSGDDELQALGLAGGASQSKVCDHREPKTPEPIIFPEQFLPQVPAVRFIEIKPVKDLKELRLSLSTSFGPLHRESPARWPIGLHPRPRGQGQFALLNSKPKTLPRPWVLAHGPPPPTTASSPYRSL